MADRSLNDRFLDLEDRMISVASLTRYGTANDLKFYIFDYAPKDELLIRKEVIKLKSRNPDIVEFDLYEMMLEIIEEEGYLEDIQRMEKDYEKDLLLREVFQPLLSVEEDDNAFLEKFKTRVPDDGRSIVLISLRPPFSIIKNTSFKSSFTFSSRSVLRSEEKLIIALTGVRISCEI